MTKSFLGGEIDCISFHLDFSYEVEKRYRKMVREDVEIEKQLVFLRCHNLKRYLLLAKRCCDGGITFALYSNNSCRFIYFSYFTAASISVWFSFALFFTTVALVIAVL